MDRSFKGGPSIFFKAFSNPAALIILTLFQFFSLPLHYRKIKKL